MSSAAAGPTEVKQMVRDVLSCKWALDADAVRGQEWEALFKHCRALALVVTVLAMSWWFPEWIWRFVRPVAIVAGLMLIPPTVGAYSYYREATA